MKVVVNIEVDVPEWFVKNGEPDIFVEVLGMNENGTTRLSPEAIYIFKESEITRF